MHRTRRCPWGSGSQAGRRPAWGLRMVVLFALLIAARTGVSADLSDQKAAARGYRLLTEQALIPADFIETTLDDVWQV